VKYVGWWRWWRQRGWPRGQGGVGGRGDGGEGGGSEGNGDGGEGGGGEGGSEGAREARAVAAGSEVVRGAAAREARAAKVVKKVEVARRDLVELFDFEAFDDSPTRRAFDAFHAAAERALAVRRCGEYVHRRSNVLKYTECSLEGFLCSNHLGRFLRSGWQPRPNVSGPSLFFLLQQLERSIHCASSLLELDFDLVEVFIQLRLALSRVLENIARIDPIFNITVVVMYME
jgi:hypothetical protein